MMKRQTPNFRRILSIFGCNVLILAAGILLIEIVFGNWWGTRGIERLNVPRNLEIEWDVSDLYPSQTGKALYKRDAQGLRGPFQNLPEVKLLTVGGSTTEQRVVPEGETWQDVISREFAKEGRRVQIVNAGVDGQSAFAHARSIHLWLRHIKGLHPQYVMAYVGINDICYSKDIHKDFFEYEQSWIRKFVRRSAIYYLYRTIRGLFRAEERPDYKINAENSQRLVTDKPLIQDYSKFEPELSDYETRLRKLLKRVREINAEPIFVTQMIYHEKNKDGGIVAGDYPFECWGETVNEVDSVNILDLINRRTMKVCAEENLTCFDLAREVEFTRDDFYDLEHNTPVGAAKIGKYLHGKLKNFDLRSPG